MAGAKIPVLEIERLSLDKDGRGLILPLDGNNLNVTVWTTAGDPSGTTANGWLRFRYTSGSTYGATGATLYAPLYSSI